CVSAGCTYSSALDRSGVILFHTGSLCFVISRSMLCHSDGICYNRLADEHGTAGDNRTENAAQRIKWAGLREFALGAGECFDALSRVLSSARAESLQVD